MCPKFRVGDWLVEPDLNRIVLADRIVQIEPKVMDVLVFLASHPGEVCPKDTIIKAVWLRGEVRKNLLIGGPRPLAGDSHSRRLSRSEVD